MCKISFPYKKIVIISMFIIIFLSSNTAVFSFNTTVGGTGPLLTFNVDVQYILAQPGDIIHFTGHASGSESSTVQGFLASNSTYIVSNMTYSPQTLTNGSITIPYEVKIPKSIPLGNQSLTAGVFTQDNQVQSRLAAQIIIGIINSTLESSTVTLYVSDNLNHSRVVQVIPQILNVGLSENLTLQEVMGNPIQVQLLTHQQYEFSIIDLQSKKHMLSPEYTVPMTNATLVIPFNLFKTNLMFSHSIVELQFDNELNGSLPVSISFFDNSNTLVFTLNTTLLLGISQWEQSFPSTANTIDINVGKKTLYVIQLNQTAKQSTSGIVFTPLTILETILVLLGMLAGGMTFHRHKKHIPTTRSGPDTQPTPVAESNNDGTTVHIINADPTNKEQENINTK